MLRRILVPVDFSPRSRSALDYASLLAGRFQSDLDLLHVWDPDRRREDRELVGLGLSSCTEAGRKMKDWLLSIAPAIRARALGRLEIGNPCRKILEAADGYDLIVMGTRGRGIVSQLLRGSLVEKVVRRVRIPVLTVRSDVPFAEVERVRLDDPILAGDLV